VESRRLVGDASAAHDFRYNSRIAEREGLMNGQEQERVTQLSPLPLRTIAKSTKLNDVCYEIRGPALAESARLEEEGHRVIKLNIGNPAPFGFEAPEEIVVDVIHHLRESQGYCESKGLYSARKAIMQYCQQIGIPHVGVDDVYVGNGVSELIVMAMQGLLNNGDEILVPAPDYPLWTAAITLSGGRAVHYRCDEQADWQPDLDDMKRKVTSRTRGIVVINPNNPTGAVYSREVLDDIVEFARQKDLILFADEIYDKILYDGAVHVPVASLAQDLLVLTFNGLSKTYRVAGFRTGWMVVSGAKHRATDYIDGLNILASMRLCANVPTQHAIQTALGGYQSINEFIKPGGRLYQQRLLAHSLLNQIEGVSCTMPKGALYLFPKLDTRRFNIKDDERFAFDLLRQEKVLVVQGTGFNWPEPDHFRIVFLPREEELIEAIGRLDEFLSTYRQ
jgi:alanine-synthesizing transaminase